jgi:long-subunit acyl-CoA synthetase (AMP-forming)
LAGCIYGRTPCASFSNGSPFKSCASGWQFIGRAETHLILATGKKFDPTGIESALRRQDTIEEAIVVGEGKMQPGLLVFASQAAISEELEKQDHAIHEAVENVNALSPPHA